MKNLLLSLLSILFLSAVTGGYYVGTGWFVFEFVRFVFGDMNLIFEERLLISSFFWITHFVFFLWSIFKIGSFIPAKFSAKIDEVLNLPIEIEIPFKDQIIRISQQIDEKIEYAQNRVFNTIDKLDDVIFKAED